MNKVELIDAIAAKTGDSKKAAETHLKAFMDVITEELVKGNSVQLVGFGTFTTAKRAEKNGVNPATKQPMVIPACTYPKFAPGKALKDAVK